MTMPDDDSALRPGLLAGLFAVGGGAAALAGALRGRRPPRVPMSPRVSPNAAPLPSGTPQLGGMPKPSEFAPGYRAEAAASNVNAALFDDVGRVVHAVRTHSGDTEADSVDATMRTLTGHAGKIRQGNAVNDGILSLDGTYRIDAPRILMQARSAMPKDVYKIFTDGYRAMDLLESIKEAANDGIAVAGVDNVKKLLNERVSNMQNQPNAKKMAEMYTSIGKGITHFNNKAVGTVGNAERVLFDQRSAYIPRSRPKEEFGIGGEALNAIGDIAEAKRPGTLYEQMNPYLGKRNNADINERVMAYFSNDAPTDIVDDLVKYVEVNVKHGGENQARKAVVDALLRGDMQRGDGKTIIRKIDRGRNSPVEGDVLSVWRGGKREDYEVGDSGLFHGLLMRPHYAIPYVADVAKIARAGTTGPITQPTFAVTSAMLDWTFITLAGRTSKLISGPLDARLKRRLDKAGVGKNKSETIRDAMAGLIRGLDMSYTATQGFLAGIHARYQQEWMRHFERKMAQSIGGDLASHPKMKASYEDAHKRFMATRYSQFMRSGYTAQALVQDWTEVNRFDKVVGKLADTRITRPWIGTLDAIRDMTRLGLFCRQVAEAELSNGGPATNKQLRQIAVNVREAGADPTRMGSSTIMSGAMSSSRFANVTAQSTVHLIRALSNPAFYSVAMSATAIRMAWTMWSEDRMDAEEVQKLHEETPTWQWTSSFPMVKPDLWFDTDRIITRRDLMWVPMGFEMGAITGVAESLVRGMVGVKEENEAGAKSAIIDALMNLVNFNVPTAFDIGMLMSGNQPVEMHMNEGAVQFQTPPISTGGTKETGGDWRGLSLNRGYMHDWTHDMLSTVLGTTGEMIGDAIEMTLDVPTQPDESFFEHASRALGVVKYDLIDKRLPRFIPIIGGNFVQKDSLGTPLSDRYYDLNNYLEAMHDQLDILQRGSTGEKTNPSGPATMTAAKITDPDLRRMVQDIERFFDHHTRKRAKEQLGILQRREKRHRGNPEQTLADQARTRNFYNDKIQAQYRVVMDQYAKFEDQQKEKWGPDWDMRSVTRAIKRDRLGLPAWVPMGLPYGSR